MTDTSSPPELILAFALLGLLTGPVSARATQRMLPTVHLGGKRWQSLITAAATAALFALMASRFGASWIMPALLFLSAAGIVLSRIDLQLKLLPNRIIIPSLGIGFALLFLDAAINQRWANLLAAIVGSAVTFLIFLVLAIISPSGMGMGDVKFSALLGLYLGYLSLGQLILGISLGFLVGAVTGVALMAAGIAGRKTSVPFGPAMFAGCIAAATFGSEIARAMLPSLFV